MRISTWSLGRRLTLSIMAFQASILLGLTFLGFAYFFNAARDGVVIHPQLMSSIAASIQRDAMGRLKLVPTPELRQFMSSSPKLWIIGREANGGDFSYGPVPETTAHMMDVSGELKTIDIRGSTGSSYLTSRFERMNTPAGQVSIWAGGGGLISDGFAVLVLATITAVIPISVLLLVTAIGLPLVIRFSLSSIRKVSSQIDKIDYEARGVQIDVTSLPREIYPMVRGLNEALRRFDEGAETTERFFVNAAHELRTPIAILQVRLDTLEAGAETEKLKAIVRRLAALTTQLLNIETFRQKPLTRHRLNLVQILAQAVGDLAPYAIAEGYTISLDEPNAPVWILGDAAALDRMFVNLIQNAIQHGGKSGAISVSVFENALVEVSDEGPGIPNDKQERIFDAFYRINGHGSGSGLGLKMVRDIAREHGGTVAFKSGNGVGCTFIVSLPRDEDRH